MRPLASALQETNQGFRLKHGGKVGKPEEERLQVSGHSWSREQLGRVERITLAEGDVVSSIQVHQRIHC